MALREAGKRCFNKTAGVPRFKKKGIRNSFTLEGTVKILENPSSRNWHSQDLRKVATSINLRLARYPGVRTGGLSVSDLT